MIDPDLLPEGISRLDLEGRVLQQNSASRKLRDDRRGQTCHLAHFDRDTPCHGCSKEEVLGDGETRRWFVATEEAGAGGVPAYFEVTLLAEKNAEGRIVGLIEILRDVSLNFRMEHQLMQNSEELGERVDRLRVELDELRQAQAALIQEEKMAAIGRLAAGLTHEMHTPLGTILSSQAMAKRLLDELPENAPAGGQRVARLRDLCHLQRLAARRMDKLIHSLQLFAHLDRAENEPIDLHQGLDACLALLEHELKGRITVEKDYDDLPAVYCRPDAINQVLMNLLQNAVQAIDGRGRLRILTRRGEPGWVRLEFEDDGCGIPEENITRLFEPGFTTKPRGIGTGLGLALSHSVVTAHGGRIEVESEVGRGTRFTVLLPIGGNR